MPSYRCMLIYSSPSVCPPALCLTVVCFLVLSGPTGKRVFLLPPPLSLSLSLSVCFLSRYLSFCPSRYVSDTLSPSLFLGGFLSGGGGVASGRAGLQKASRTPRSYLHHLTMLPSTWDTPITMKGSGARARFLTACAGAAGRAQNNKKKCASHAIIFKVLSAYQLLHVHFLAKTPSQNGEGKHRILGLYRDYTTPKRLKVTYSTTRLKENIPNLEALRRQLPRRCLETAAAVSGSLATVR